MGALGALFGAPLRARTHPWADFTLAARLRVCKLFSKAPQGDLVASKSSFIPKKKQHLPVQAARRWAQVAAGSLVLGPCPPVLGSAGDSRDLAPGWPPQRCNSGRKQGEGLRKQVKTGRFDALSRPSLLLCFLFFPPKKARSSSAVPGGGSGLNSALPQPYQPGPGPGRFQGPASSWPPLALRCGDGEAEGGLHPRLLLLLAAASPVPSGAAPGGFACAWIHLQGCFGERRPVGCHK